MEHAIEIIKTNGKRPKIAPSGFTYHFQKKCSDFIRRRCSKFSSLKCPTQIFHATPNRIFAESVSNVPHQLLVQLPKEEHVRRTIRKHRGYNNPSKPSLIQLVHAFPLFSCKLYLIGTFKRFWFLLVPGSYLQITVIQRYSMFANCITGFMKIREHTSRLPKSKGSLFFCIEIIVKFTKEQKKILRPIKIMIIIRLVFLRLIIL
ncbi:hypothetical protein QTP88_012666 [Uroleucon formosanum]